MCILYLVSTKKMRFSKRCEFYHFLQKEANRTFCIRFLQELQIRYCRRNLRILLSASFSPVNTFPEITLVFSVFIFPSNNVSKPCPAMYTCNIVVHCTSEPAKARILFGLNSPVKKRFPIIATSCAFTVHTFSPAIDWRHFRNLNTYITSRVFPSYVYQISVFYLVEKRSVVIYRQIYFSSSQFRQVQLPQLEMQLLALLRQSRNLVLKVPYRM